MIPSRIRIVFLITLVCISCKDENKSIEYPVLKASLNEKHISVYDIFKEVEVISLETTGESILFERTKEGIKIDPRFVTDSYMIRILEYEHKEALRNILSPADAAQLDRMKAEDNNWLIKFIF